MVEFVERSWKNGSRVVLNTPLGKKKKNLIRVASEVETRIILTKH
jgi:hypothetical protein